MKNRFPLVMLALFTIASWVHAQLDAVKTYVREVAEQSAYPGFAVVLVENQRIVWASGFGEITQGSSRAMTADTPLAIGSMTKSFTALAIMQLVEEGKLDLDTPIVTYLPWFQTAIKNTSDQITLRMLLSNSSGLPSLDVGIGSNQTDEQADTRLAKQLNAYVLNREPGSSFEYSNEGFALAGLIGAEVTGKAYIDYLQERILDPLAMSQSSTDLERIKTMDTTLGHRCGLQQGIPAETTLTTMAYAAAGSLLHCSAKDLGHYLIALLNEGRFANTQVLSPKGVATLWQNHINMPEDPDAEGPSSYGFGWMLSTVDGRRVVHHGGATGTMTSYAMLEPDRGTAVAVITNIPTLDGYHNTGLSTIANNMLHLYHREPLSTYGHPKEKDATLNDFDLEPEKQAAYMGSYVAEGLSNYTVFVEKDGEGNLIAREMTGQELTGMSRIDFINPSRVVMRSIGTRKPGQFKLSLQGQVYGFTYSGTQLFKSQGKTASSQTVRVENQIMAMALPDHWQIKRTGDNIEAQSNTQGDVQLQAFFTPNDGIAPTVTGRFEGQEILFQGAVHHETVKPYTWKQQSVILQEQDQQRGYLWLSTKTPQGQYNLLFSAPAQNLTQQIQDVIFPILKSINLKNS